MSLSNPSKQLWKAYADTAWQEVTGLVNNTYKTLFTLRNARILSLIVMQENDETAPHNMSLRVTVDGVVWDPQATASNNAQKFGIYPGATDLGDSQNFVQNAQAGFIPFRGSASAEQHEIDAGHTITVEAKVDVVGTNQKISYKRIYQLLEGI